MRKLTAVVGGAGAAAVLAASVVIADASPSAPAYGAALRHFGSCSELRQWYVDQAVGQVTAWGWGYPFISAPGVHNVTATPVTEAGAAQARTPSTAVTSSPTGTNVQEAGVDEPDVAKTDGHVLVRVTNGRLLVDYVTGRSPRQLSSLRLPASSGRELLLDHGHAIVFGATSGRVTQPVPPRPRPWLTPNRPTPGSPRLAQPVTSIRPALPVPEQTRVVDVDLTDPTHPRLVEDQTFRAALISMRQYGDVIRLVTTIGLPNLHFVTPGASGGRSTREALAHNRRVVRESTIGDWLPAVTDNRTRRTRPLVGCREVLHPSRYAGVDTVTVTGWDVSHPATTASVAVTTDGQLVYSSTDRLYVATTAYRSGLRRPVAHDVAMRVDQPLRPLTEVHAFALHGIGASYTCSGQVVGTVRDRWSFDEHGGYLRVAVTRTTRTGSTDNGIDVLAEKDGRLVPAGGVHGLGRGEAIESVRWFDHLAVLVTFRQLDPLYTVDLRNPRHPRAAGELSMRGFSAYLHPIGDHLLLALGQDATARGKPLGAQAAVFDITHLSHPRRVGRITFAPGSALAATLDPRAFTWLPASRTAITAFTGPDAVAILQRAVELRVARDGSITAHTRGLQTGATFRALPLSGDRVVLVAHGVRLLGVVR